MHVRSLLAEQHEIRLGHCSAPRSLDDNLPRKHGLCKGAIAKSRPILELPSDWNARWRRALPGAPRGAWCCAGTGAARLSAINVSYRFASLKIYFGFTVAGDRSSIGAGRRIVGLLQQKGHEVLIQHLVNDDAWSQDRLIPPQQIYARDMRWLGQCDLFLAGFLIVRQAERLAQILGQEFDLTKYTRDAITTR